MGRAIRSGRSAAGRHGDTLSDGCSGASHRYGTECGRRTFCSSWTISLGTSNRVASYACANTNHAARDPAQRILAEHDRVHPAGPGAERVLAQSALAGQASADSAEFDRWLEATVRASNADPTPFGWGGQTSAG